jgi:hypothetical protein
MNNPERLLIDYHRAKGDSKVWLRCEVLAPEGTLYLMRFYNPFGSCYSSLDKIDENGEVVELGRCHRLDERKMLDSITKRSESHETDG